MAIYLTIININSFVHNLCKCKQCFDKSKDLQVCGNFFKVFGISLIKTPYTFNNQAQLRHVFVCLNQQILYQTRQAAYCAGEPGRFAG
jgi:hypothetical protein